MSRHIGTLWAVALVVCGGSSTTLAGTISGGLVVEVSSSLGSASREFEVDSFDWSLGETVVLTDDSTGAAVATILGDTSLSFDADPVVQLSFNVQAGAAATNVTVTSPTLVFSAPLAGAVGRASAGTVVVDNNGNGASISGGFMAGSRSFQPVYNGNTVFQEMVGNSTVNTPFGAMSQSEDFPPAGFQGLGTVSDMATSFSFTLSGGDFAVGNSVFAIIPEPATTTLAVVMGLALVGVFRRR